MSDQEFPCGLCRNTYQAVINNHLNCLTWAIENKVSWHIDTTRAAALKGSLECLQLAYENDCPWHDDTSWSAAYYGKLNCLRYIYENCGDVATWDRSRYLKKFEDYQFLSAEVKEFLSSVQKDWYQGNNVSTNVKPAK